MEKLSRIGKLQDGEWIESQDGDEKMRVVVENESILTSGNLGPKLWWFSRPSFEQRESKVERGMFWVNGVRLLVVVVLREFSSPQILISNENLENRWQLVLWFMVFFSSENPWLMIFNCLSRNNTLRNYRAVEHFRCLIVALF